MLSQHSDCRNSFLLKSIMWCVDRCIEKKPDARLNVGILHSCKSLVSSNVYVSYPPYCDFYRKATWVKAPKRLDKGQKTLLFCLKYVHFFSSELTYIIYITTVMSLYCVSTGKIIHSGLFEPEQQSPELKSFAWL